MDSCNFEGHVVICGWNTRGPHLIEQFTASGRKIVVVAEERAEELPPDVFFVKGNPSKQELLVQGGLKRAAAAVILWSPKFGGDDSRTILTGLAVKAVAPDVYTVMELHDPANERYARYAHVDELLYTDNLIADITAICTHYEGLSSFIRDILSTADDGHSFASFDVPSDFEGRTVGDVFAHFRGRGLLPVGVIVPPEDAVNVPVSEWLSRVDPPEDETVTLPMKAVCIKKN